jgi:hypothetical protein
VARLTGAATGQTLQVKGLAALRRDLKKVDANIDKQAIRPGLKDVGQIVANEAKSIAAAKFNTLSTGQMARKIAPAVLANAVYVRSKATRNGYAYPGVYEFGGRRVQITAGGGMTRIGRRSRIGARLANGGKAQGEFGEYGPNAVLYPALENKVKEVERGMEQFLDQFLRRIDL